MNMIYRIFKLIIQTMAKAGEMEANAYHMASKASRPINLSERCKKQ